MTVPNTFDDILNAFLSHKSQVESFTYTMQHQKIVAMVMDPLLPASPNRKQVQAAFRKSNYTIDLRLSDTIATLVNNLRKQRVRNARAH